MNRHLRDLEPLRGDVVMAGPGQIDAEEPNPAQRLLVALFDLLAQAPERLAPGRLGRAQVGPARGGLAKLPERLERLGQRPQPLFVFEVDAIDDLNQLAQLDQRVAPATRSHRGLGSDPLHGGVVAHRRPHPAARGPTWLRALSSRSLSTCEMIWRAREARRPRAIASSSITWTRCSASR